MSASSLRRRLAVSFLVLIVALTTQTYAQIPAAASPAATTTPVTTPAVAATPVPTTTAPVTTPSPTTTTPGNLPANFYTPAVAAGTPITPTTTASPAATTTVPAAVTTTPAVTASPATTITPATTVATPATTIASPAATVVPATTSTAPAPHGAQVGVTTAPVNSSTPANAAPVVVPSSPDTLPPGPPSDWAFLPVDTQMIFGVRIEGPYITPWTKPKSFAFNQVLVQRYLRSVDVNNLANGAIQSYQYNVPTAGRKLLMHSRALSQSSTTTADGVVTGVVLRVTVNTNSIRLQSEVNTIVIGMSSGTLESDLALGLGATISNFSFTQTPTSIPYNQVNTNVNTGSGGVPGYIIGVIVGVILVLLPIPAYLMYRRHRRHHLEAIEKQQAEAAASRQRMQSRIVKAGGKSFTKALGGGDTPPGTIGGNLDNFDVITTTSSFHMNAKSGIGGPESSEGGSRQNSFLAAGRTPSRTSPYQQHQMLLYQQQSLGPAFPPVSGASPQRSFTQQSSARRSIYPMRSGDETSTSSGNVSEKH